MQSGNFEISWWISVDVDCTLGWWHLVDVDSVEDSRTFN
jgi:hypothetical protein